MEDVYGQNKGLQNEGLEHSLDPLICNHIEFMKTHRGEIGVLDGGVYLCSNVPGVSCWIPYSDNAIVPKNCTTVHLIPGLDSHWPQLLSVRGFRYEEQLSYMELGEDVYVQARAGIIPDITTVKDDLEAVEFSAVQISAFLEGEHGNQVDAWRQCLNAMALINYKRREQTFYLGKLRDEVVACTLVVRTPMISGIYAVGTRPDYRNQGVSTAMLARAVRDARDSGAKRVILQAIRGSYAEGFYTRLGFTERFYSQIWSIPR
jgi:GNAT superfamily N-acetyltransferase